jgi:CheY-like chemotaxis protein
MMKTPSQFIVVDDDPVNNLVCKFAISSYASAASIHLFTNPELALAWIKDAYHSGTDQEKTILFLDINMPVMSGWEFLDEFSEFPDTYHAKITIFILSSSIDPEDKQKAASHPLVSGYFSKPLRKETIHQLLMED